MSLAAPIPKNGFPSVERGYRRRRRGGSCAGFPVVISRAILYDGKYHDVRLSDMAFKDRRLAGVQGSHEAGAPAQLEPVMHVEVYAPDTIPET